jgi:hypothetical protein
MKRIDRLNLIDRIGRELQARMSYADIDVYLSEFGVDIKKDTPSINSKWVYTKNLLANVPDNTILKLADELKIEHDFVGPREIDLSDSKFWLAGHFRLFMSHLSAFKAKAAKLQNALRAYGISAFVAHEDIEPTKEWEEEIEKALFSMDALAAILTPGFKESNWTDQEIGVAVGRDVLVIPIRKGLDPYGFIAKYQGLQSEGKTVGEVADSIFQILANHPKTKSRMADALVEQIIVSSIVSDAKRKLSLLRRVGMLPDRHLEKLRDNIIENKNLAESGDFLSLINTMLKERGISISTKKQQKEELSNDSIPF